MPFISEEGRVENRLFKYKEIYEQKRRILLDRIKEGEKPNDQRPMINEVSSQIVSAKSNKNKKVEDRLIENAEKLKKEREEKALVELSNTKNCGKPMISEFSKKIERKEDIVTHLIEQQRIVEEKKEVLKNKFSDEKRFKYAPNVDSKKNKKMADKYMERLATKQKSDCIIDKNTHKPQVLKKSEQLAKKLGSSEDRLLNPKQKPKEVYVELSHTPQIDAKSNNIIAEKSKTTENVEKWKELYELSSKQQIEKQERKKQRDEEIQRSENFTFKPQIIEKPSTSSQILPVHQRANKWAEEKEKKKSDLRDFLMDREVEECTFKPLIIAKFEIPPKFDEVRSYQQYVDKMKNHRENVKNMQIIENNKAGSGKVWENKATIPIEFGFCKGDVGIKSLQKPVQIMEEDPTKKFHQLYPKSDLMEKQKTKSPGSHIVENIIVEHGDDIDEAMGNLHKELMNLDL